MNEEQSAVIPRARTFLFMGEPGKEEAFDRWDEDVPKEIAESKARDRARVKP